MKFKATLAALILTSVAFGQSKWMFHTSVEETHLIGDKNSSFNIISLNDLAGNAGARVGMYYNHSENIGAEITLGVSGSANTGVYATRIVPVEIVGHYNILSQVEGLNTTDKFNVDLGIGSALVRAQTPSYNASGSFGFSENVSLGASWDMDVLPGGMLTIGYRHTFFVDDYIDGTVSGSGNDSWGRFFTAARWNLGSSNKEKAALANAMAKADQLNAELGAAEAKAKSLESEAEKAQKKNAELKNTLAATEAELEALRTATAEKEEAVEETPTFNGYAVIVASFSSKAAAQTFADEYGENAKVIAVPEIGKFRVAQDVYTSYAKAKTALEELKVNEVSCWIIKL